MVPLKMNGDDCITGRVTPEIAGEYVRGLFPGPLRPAARREGREGRCRR
jgi:hypothetical protein